MTLPEVLRDSGWDTRAVVANGNLAEVFGFAQGFAYFKCPKGRPLSPYADAAFLQPLVRQVLDDLSVPPYFLWLHYVDPHDPYLPHPEHDWNPGYSGTFDGTDASLEPYRLRAPSPANRQRVIDLYDGEIAYLDLQLRRVFEAVLLGDRAGETAMVVLSDHGEEFRDHGRFQHDQVFDELARVPLVIHAGTALERKRWRGRVDTPVELVDVAPTVSELLGVDWRRTGWMGRSLVSLMDPATRAEAAHDSPRPVFTELVRERRTHEYGAVTWQGWKYITHRQTTNGRTWEHLFDLSRDPLEQSNLIDAEDAESSSRLQALRETWRAFSEANLLRANELGRGEPLPLSDEQLLELKRLGYTGGPR